MKILLDESIDVDLRKDFPVEHDVATVRYMRWLGLKNGALLRQMEAEGFECLITADRSIPYQQNLSKLSCLIIVLDTPTTLTHFQAALPQILRVLDAPPESRLAVITAT